LAIIVIWPKKIFQFKETYTDINYIIIRPQRKTLGDNLNLAVANCGCEYFVRVDGDDWDSWGDIDRSIFIQKCNWELEERKFNACCPTYHIDVEGKDRILHNAPQGAGIIWKTQVFKDLGGYDETLQYQADLDFYIRFVQKYKKMEFSHIKYGWNINPDSQSKQRIKLLKQREKILKKYNLKDNQAPHFGAYYL
jgi:hypothetical protein